MITTHWCRFHLTLNVTMWDLRWIRDPTPEILCWKLSSNLIISEYLSFGVHGDRSNIKDEIVILKNINMNLFIYAETEISRNQMKNNIKISSHFNLSRVANKQINKQKNTKYVSKKIIKNKTCFIYRFRESFNYSIHFFIHSFNSNHFRLMLCSSYIYFLFSYVFYCFIDLNGSDIGIWQYP